MKSSLVLVLFLIASLRAHALLTLPTQATYESGRTLCEKTYKPIVAHENGFYVTVPVDYANPSRGQTDIYAFFSGGYDPAKETLLYFTGGPGQTVHWGLFPKPMPYNVLIMEHRGIGCSRPATVEQFLDPSFYSSENVARDAEEIRRHLKISKLTIYGISYGTVPATIYSSLFPNAVRSTILEGVVFSGTSELWEGPHRRKLLQKMLDTLPVNVLTRMNEVSTRAGVPKTWFAQIARGELTSFDGLKKLKEKMSVLADDQIFERFVDYVKSMYEPIAYTPHILFTMNEVPYFMISCQELGLSSPMVNTIDMLIDGKLVPTIDLNYSVTCGQLKAAADKTYYATRYPLQNPVTYFQGGDDSATVSPQGIRHYKQVSRGAKQLMILVKGGHNPNLQLIAEEDQHQLKFFDYAFKGQKIPTSLLKESNSQTDHFWAYTAK